mmetsp:Transcript_8471/g.30115  ORF Transcript_8471/g.30115 Transcript_8471/m.30115 type:complete len:371 (+) Transcript_8471:376-1488(+)
MEPLPATAVADSGADGGPQGRTTGDGSDGSDVPSGLCATTRARYSSPSVRPATSAASSDRSSMTKSGAIASVVDAPPGYMVTVNRSSGAPPSLLCGMKRTRAPPGSGLHTTLRGLPGAPAGTTGAETADGSLWPDELMATTWNVHATPLRRWSNAATSRPSAGTVTEAPRPPDTEVTRYESMRAPPSESGGENVTSTPWLRGAPTTSRGGPGGPAGMTMGLGSDGSDSPTRLTATTAKAYSSPFRTPVLIVTEVRFAGHDRPSAPPCVHTTRYPVIGAPPVSAGGSHDTSTLLSAAWPRTRVGGAGGPAGTTGGDGSENGPTPTSFTAATRTVTVEPLTRSPTRQRTKPSRPGAASMRVGRSSFDDGTTR